MRSVKRYLVAVVLLILSVSCEEDYLPKPKGYNRIDLPDHRFEPLLGSFPYTLEKSQLATFVPDTSRYSEPGWGNIRYELFDAEINLTYKKIKDKQSLKDYMEDSYKLTSKHQVRAYAIEERALMTPQGYTGVVSELEGQVPTQFQFYLTDSTENFIRGALYFNTAMKNDSLAPVIEYIKVDMAHLMNTLKWKE
ncbi:gliding motility lipoprotein GldD [Penaeicola halotolerans]|uniref:gliding motility lipoprotein GldD n=1 Tax=Penaeicola halotolerans TaxID=2793196 RepID=UPI001CF8DD49|nr:gliding motility lipoprotein GldD [Penaeicola halotolerans]